MNKPIYISLLLLLFAAQLFIPSQMIYQQEDTLRTGTAYKFKTEPIDPTDPFRGKYITLNYDMDSYETNEEDWPYKSPVFVYLKTDNQGFAAVKTLSKILLDTEDDYVVAESYNIYKGKLNFSLPFDRFYMNENKALDAQISVRKAQMDTSRTCYALVYIKDGTAVLEDVLINDVSIQKFVEEYQESID